MKYHHHHLQFILVTLSTLLSYSTTLDTISPNQTLKDGNTLVSKRHMYELGFFSPGNSKNRYLGIWYKKISTGTVAWVANRDTPIADSSGTFQINGNGTLLILTNGNTIIWSSSSTLSGTNTNININPVAQLLDTGNLVVWENKKNNDDNNRTSQTLIWQSFDYPGDTLLPGMKFGKDLVTGMERRLTSWKSPDDPSPGSYVYWVDPNGYPQIFKRQGQVLRVRLGPWNGVKFRGLPTDEHNSLYSAKFVVNEKEVYYKYELKSKVVQRRVLRWDGNTVQLHWVERVKEWIVYGNAAVDTCGQYGLCGPFGSCSVNKYPPCSCMEGFEPRLSQEWETGDWSSGCMRKRGLVCGSGDGFRRVSRVKFPDTQSSWYNVSMGLGECEVVCKRNCSCTAYANLDVRNGGSGCLLWFGELMDIREYDDDQDLYIRMVVSELPVIARMINKIGVLAVVMLTSSAALLVSIVAYACRKRKKRLHKKGRGRDKKNTSVQMEHLDEVLFFSLDEIAKATRNFNINKKIGEGGFGPVYKGVLEDGREIAVKRLSETSQQGLEEFKNEVVCIAKLQHRNLVKLLGCCIHGSEKILIYEYMPNKSLDSFLFDETKSSMLDWPQRFRIINGMARGILYLHQDSRLQIIHRDLKASNILLDGDMNPKISDFGLARKFVGFDNTAKTKKVVGTYGYIPPEYAVHGRFSVKSDVFSFGVLVLEMISGKKNREFTHGDHSDNLLGHAWRLYKEDRPIELMCPSLQGSCNESEIVRSIHVGLLCVQHHAEDRPTMLSVVLMLVSERALPPPKPPAFFSEESFRKTESVLSINEYTITSLYAR